jgi:hypothetical protein
MPPPPPPAQNTAFSSNDKDYQARIFKTEAEKTRNFIFGMAGVYFVGNLITVAMAGAFTGVYIVGVILFPILFSVAAIIAPKQPLIGAIVAAVILLIILIILISFAGNAGASWVGWVYFLLAAGSLVAAFMSANKAEAARKLMR